jgi:hypothetical protein
VESLAWAVWSGHSCPPPLRLFFGFGASVIETERLLHAYFPRTWQIQTFVRGEINKMRRIRWKWFLPVTQLVFAMAALIYGPFEFKNRLLQDGAAGDNNMLEYNGQHFPAPIERASKAINFPALVLAYPLRGYENQLLFYRNNYTFVRVSPRDVGFFGGVVIFWYWVGWKMDQSQGRSPKITRSRRATIAGLMCGFVLGILTSACALQLLIQDWHWRPERQIGAFGIVWSVALVAYFTGQLKQPMIEE